MKRSDAFPSKYISKDDVKPPLALTIANVTKESVPNGDEQKEVVTMYFDGYDKPLIVNSVNWMTCEDAYGEDSDGWEGKPVELFCDPNVMFGNKRVGGVRIRIPVEPKPASSPFPKEMGRGVSVPSKDQPKTLFEAKRAFEKLIGEHKLNGAPFIENAKVADGSIDWRVAYEEAFSAFMQQPA